MFEWVRARENSLMLGMITSAVICIGIAVFVIFMYTRTTDALNNDQRFRAVCEYEGGRTVEDLCIRGDRVITLDLT